MDHTYQRPLQMPTCYAVLSAEEMTYTEGGAFSIKITPEQAAAFGMNVVVNFISLMGQYSFTYAVNGVINGLADGLDLGGILNHYWGRLNTWSRIASFGLAGLGGYYAYAQARGLYLSVKNLVGSIKDAFNQSRGDAQDAQQPALVAA